MSDILCPCCGRVQRVYRSKAPGELDGGTNDAVNSVGIDNNKRIHQPIKECPKFGLRTCRSNGAEFLVRVTVVDVHWHRNSCPDPLLSCRDPFSSAHAMRLGNARNSCCEVALLRCGTHVCPPSTPLLDFILPSFLYEMCPAMQYGRKWSRGSLWRQREAFRSR